MLKPNSAFPDTEGVIETLAKKRLKSSTFQFGS